MKKEELKNLIESVVKEQLETLTKECVCDELNEQQSIVPTFNITPEMVADLISDNAIEDLIYAKAQQLEEQLPFDYKKLYFVLKRNQINQLLYKAVLLQLNDIWDRLVKTK